MVGSTHRLAGGRQEKQHTLRAAPRAPLESALALAAFSLCAPRMQHGAALQRRARCCTPLRRTCAHTRRSRISPEAPSPASSQVFRRFDRPTPERREAPPFGIKVIRGQAARGKARACACLAAKQDTMRKPPGRKRGREAFLECFISEQGIQRSHYSFSKRSTLVTNTVAPPTVTSSG